MTEKTTTILIVWVGMTLLVLMLSLMTSQAPVERAPKQTRSTGICELNAVVCDSETTTITRTVTAYTASADETDDEPCIAARNYNICEDKTKKVVATNEFPLGTQLMIDNVPYTVLDRMNKRYPNRYDILVDTRATAMAFGIQEKEIKVIK